MKEEPSSEEKRSLFNAVFPKERSNAEEWEICQQKETPER